MFFITRTSTRPAPSARIRWTRTRVRVADPSGAGNTAELIDATFANSAFETTTTTENAFVRAIAEQIGDVGAIVMAILGPVLFTLLLVCGNAMAQSVRERTNGWP